MKKGKEGKEKRGGKGKWRQGKGEKRNEAASDKMKISVSVWVPPPLPESLSFLVINRIFYKLGAHRCAKEKEK